MQRLDYQDNALLLPTPSGSSNIFDSYSKNYGEKKAEAVPAGKQVTGDQCFAFRHQDMFLNHFFTRPADNPLLTP